VDQALAYTNKVPTKKREAANVEEKAVQYLYKEDGDFVFMDPSNHAHITVAKELIGDSADLLKDNLPCTMFFFDERPVDVTLPAFVQLDVTAVHPGGDGAVTRKATVETGAVNHVPLFIRVGDTIKVDTRTHERVERVSN
jgi:elongation factor P